MVKAVAVAALVLSVGCGAILNGSQSTIVVPPGATVDGVPGSIAASNQIDHLVMYPDGRRCIVESHINVGYVIADILLWTVIGVVVDGVSGDWDDLETGCPGVVVQ